MRSIVEGVELVTDAMSRTALGPYQLQAAIAAVHAEAVCAEDTDWPQILALYQLLERLSDNPVVTLNHAVAAAMVEGPRAGLALLEALDADQRMAQHHRLDVVRAHLLEMAGDREAAIALYRTAARRTTSAPERRHLEARAVRLSEGGETCWSFSSTATTHSRGVAGQRVVTMAALIRLTAGPLSAARKDRIMRLLDLSHVIEHQMVTYPGLPGPEISEHLSFEASAAHYAPGTEFAIGRLSMVANTGTYLDTPAHRYRDGHDLADLPLDRCVLLPAVVIDGGSGPIGPDVFSDVEVDGSAVLLRTGWDRHWGTDRYGDPTHPYLTGAGARALVERGAALVGIDSVNIDDTSTGKRPAHTVLLAASIPIVEHLTGLHGLPATGVRFTAVPPAVRGLATFPVRAFASVP